MTDSPSQVSLAEQHKTVTRRRIEAAARSVFAAKGYTRATIDDVIAAARVSRGTLYLHFRTKPELMSAAVSELTVEGLEAMRQLAAVLVGGSRQDLRNWMDQAIALFERHRPLALATQEAELAQGSEDRGRHNVFQLLPAASAWIERWPTERQAEALLRLELCRLQLEHYMWGFAPLIALDNVDVAELLTDLWWRELQLPSA